MHVYAVAERVVVIDRGMVAGGFLTRDNSLEDLMDKMIHVAEVGTFE